MVIHIWAGLTFAEAAKVLSINPNTAAAALWIGIFLTPRFRDQPSPSPSPQPFTIGSANTALINESSWQKAMEDKGFAFQSATPNNPPSTQNAIEVLSQDHLNQ
ncbi:MAG: hypothetical protein FJW36_00165 [Acidobacteria bacterium]|nr:hypothetical protein [Acidobacteriota bacterium]